MKNEERKKRQTMKEMRQKQKEKSRDRRWKKCDRNFATSTNGALLCSADSSADATTSGDATFENDSDDASVPNCEMSTDVPSTPWNKKVTKLFSFFKMLPWLGANPDFFFLGGGGANEFENTTPAVWTAKAFFK
jgi:hypothetical protein